MLKLIKNLLSKKSDKKDVKKPKTYPSSKKDGWIDLDKTFGITKPWDM